MGIGIDVISDLHLAPGEVLDWERKATSLYCIIAGNISSDTLTIHQALLHLSKCYQGVFYIAGALEYADVGDIPLKTKQLVKISSMIRNVSYLHNHVVIIDGVAILGATGWYGYESPDSSEELKMERHRFDDVSYLGSAIARLQLHMDVRKIVVVTGAVPGNELFFGEGTDASSQQLAPNVSLVNDTEHKVSTWVYGNYKKEVDITLRDINYVCNPRLTRMPYWAKRITIEI